MPNLSLAAAVPEITSREFAALRELVHGVFGFDLRTGKESLATARLSRHVRAGGYSSVGQYLKAVESDKSGERLTELVDAMTTNHTGFLREPEHFRFLANVVAPELRHRLAISVWSAGSSTGEEAWSILFTFDEAFQSGPRPPVRILGSDISTRVLRTARQGSYAGEKLRSLSPVWMHKYFRHELIRSTWQVRPEWRSQVEFRRQNLIEPLGVRGPFAVIFCRNVMIYFDKKTQIEVVRKLESALEPGGYLIVGHSETLNGVTNSLRYVRPAIYRRPF